MFLAIYSSLCSSPSSHCISVLGEVDGGGGGGGGNGLVGVYHIHYSSSLTPSAPITPHVLITPSAQPLHHTSLLC